VSGNTVIDNCEFLDLSAEINGILIRL